MTLDFSQRPTCFYCGKPVTTQQINQLKSEALGQLPAPEGAGLSRKIRDKSSDKIGD